MQELPVFCPIYLLRGLDLIRSYCQMLSGTMLGMVEREQPGFSLDQCFSVCMFLCYCDLWKKQFLPNFLFQVSPDIQVLGLEKMNFFETPCRIFPLSTSFHSCFRMSGHLSWDNGKASKAPRAQSLKRHLLSESWKCPRLPTCLTLMLSWYHMCIIRVHGTGCNYSMCKTWKN